MKPQYLVPSHTYEIIGEDEIRETLTNYSAAIKYVYEETLKGINEGKTVDELVRTVKLPDEVAELLLTETSGTMDEDFIEAAIIREILFAFVAEVPLAKDAVLVSGGLQCLGESDDTESEALATKDGVRNTDGEGRASAHEGGTGGGAGGVDLKIGEAGRLLIEGVQVWCS